jgi:hypothetical protein
MMTESVSIHFTPEAGREHIHTLLASIAISNLRSTPDLVEGRLIDATEDQIVQFELELTPVVVNFRGKRYSFASLRRTGEFKLQKAW